MHDAMKHKGADIYKVHVPTRKIVQLTQQAFTPNTGAADWSKTPLPSWGVYNLGPCPLPGGKLVFVSDRNAFKATNPGYAPNALALQLFVMDDDGSNVECIGHLNLGMALHPVILKDGRIMFSSLESQGLRSHHLWGVWSIHPDGTNWGPLVSAFEIGNGTADSPTSRRSSPTAASSSSRTTTSTTSASAPTTSSRSQPPDGYAAVRARLQARPAQRAAAARPPRRRPAASTSSFPFSPYGIEALTPFVRKGDWPSRAADPGQEGLAAPRQVHASRPARRTITC